METKIDMPDKVSMILDRLSAEGHEAVIIGGCVRDSIMGITPHDWDIATSAQPTETMDCFKEYNLMTSGLKHGTVTVIIDHEPYEVTTYRIDGKYTDYRRPDSVSFTSDLAEDILRRDFTINAIAYDGKRIIDLHNGVGDLQRGIIRCVGNADDRFQEDPLRVMRAIRFSARFGFEIEAETKAAMKRNAHLLTKIAIERKQSEFSKALCSDHVKVLKNYKDILSYVMPGISQIDDFDHEIDIVADCHDICEKLAILVDSLGISSYTDIVKLLSADMKYPNKVIKSVKNIFEGRKLLIVNSFICVKNMMSKFSLDDVKHILFFKYAKIKNSNIKERENILDGIEQMIRFAETMEMNKEKYCYNFKGLAINGRDLKELGVDDLEIKQYLTELLEMVITKQVNNTKNSLIEVVKISRV